MIVSARNYNFFQSSVQIQYRHQLCRNTFVFCFFSFSENQEQTKKNFTKIFPLFTIFSPDTVPLSVSSKKGFVFFVFLDKTLINISLCGVVFINKIFLAFAVTNIRFLRWPKKRLKFSALISLSQFSVHYSLPSWLNSSFREICKYSDCRSN